MGNNYKKYNVMTYVLSQNVFEYTVKAKNKKEAIQKAEKLANKNMQPDSWIDYSIEKEIKVEDCKYYNDHDASVPECDEILDEKFLPIYTCKSRRKCFYKNIEIDEEIF